MKVYLGIPYTKLDHEKVFEIANKVSVELIKKGFRVFSPITMGHPFAEYLPEEKRTDGQFWLDLFLPEMETCDELIMVSIGKNGFELIEESSGCQAEIEYSKNLNKPLNYYFYEE